MQLAKNALDHVLDLALNLALNLAMDPLLHAFILSQAVVIF